MKHMVTFEDLIDNAHITISFPVRVTTGLFKPIPAFLAGYVVFDCPDPTNMEESESMWGFLDVAAKDLDLFVKANPQ